MVDIEELLEKARETGGKTIPELCKETGISDKHKVMEMIARLEKNGKVKLSGFEKAYREDGGSIYLAKYCAY